MQCCTGGTATSDPTRRIYSLSNASGTAKRVALTRACYGRLVSHVRAVLPDEGVGILGGSEDGQVLEAIPLPNLGGPRAFLADPHAQFLAERRLRGAGRRVLAVYHSHPVEALCGTTITDVRITIDG